MITSNNSSSVFQAELHVSQAEAYLQLCDFQSAAACYRQASALQPGVYSNRLTFIYYLQVRASTALCSGNGARFLLHVHLEYSNTSYSSHASMQNTSKNKDCDTVKKQKNSSLLIFSGAHKWVNRDLSIYTCAQGQCLFDRGLFVDALEAFNKAAEMKPGCRTYKAKMWETLEHLDWGFRDI